MGDRLTRHTGGGVVRIDGDRALIATAASLAPVVDDAYDWGRIAAAAALSDVYAMGGRPVVAVNLVAGPSSGLAEVLRGGRDMCAAAGCVVSGDHRVEAEEPTYGLAVTGLAHPDRLLRDDTGRAGLALSITKPLGLGVLTARHRATGERCAEAVDVMTTLNATASAAAVRAGIRCATTVAGLGLLGHLHALAAASGVTAVLDPSAVPFLDGAEESARHVSADARRTLAAVRPHTDLAAVDEDTALLLADPQPSGGLLLAGELDGAVVIGELAARADGRTVIVR